MSNDENHARQENELIRQARQQIGIDSTKRQTQDTEDQGTVVRCPHCGERIPLQMDMGHDLVRCPSCESEFNLLFEVETASFSGKSPKTLGHYQLLEHLGMGQYGSVWKALDTQLDRVVALKIPRRTELAPGESEIFLREARAAAQLKHPHIVSVHEIGQADGVIYISSDFVRGANLREWLGERILTATEAAEFCAKLANALEHAHQAGVIHRDLKPANIMVDLEGEPHVMDLGMAKRSTGEVTVTMEGQIIGTPAYMSPEQARGEAHGVDGRADIYSLGVILFELLTGERPFRGEKRMLMVQIISDEPPSPRKYNSHIPKDLETICLKCLEKTPIRRFASAGDVERDLRHWLNREPIQARPISRLHRVVRWCQRRPAVAALLALVILVTALGFSLVTWQWRLAGRAQFLEAVKQQQRGDRYFGTLLTAVDEMLVEVGAEQLQDEPRMESARRSIVEQALEYYDWLISEEGSATELRPHLARARLQAGKLRVWLGDYVKAEEILVQYLEDLRQLPTETLSRQIGADAEAEGRLELATARIKLGKEDQAERDLTQLLQAASAADRESDDSKPQLSRAAAASLLGELLMLQERNDEAEKRLKQALGYLGSAEDNSSHEVVESRFGVFHLLAICHTDSPRFREGGKYFQKALDLRPMLLEGGALTSRRSLAHCLADYALCLEKTDQPQLADKIRRQTIELQQQMVRDYPEVPDIRRSLAVAYQNLGASLSRIMQQDVPEADKKRSLGEADAAFQKAVGLLEELHSLYPEVPDYADVLAGTFNLWSSALTGMGRAEEAVECLEKARNFWKQRLETNPDNMNVRSDYGGVLNNLANRYRALQRLDEAKAMAEEAIVHQEQARAASPENTKYLQYLAIHYLTLGRVCREREEMGVAIPAYRKAVTLYEELHDKLGNKASYRSSAEIKSECGFVQFRIKDASVADREEGLKLMQRALELAPESISAQYVLGISLTEMKRWDEALAVLKDLPEKEGVSGVRRAWSAVHLARALGHLGKIDAAHDRLAQARTFAEALEKHDEIDTDIAEVEQLLKQSGSSSDPSKDDDEG